MPSRNNTMTKNIIVKEKPVKEKPVVTVTDESLPEEILHSSWTFLNVVQFFNTFRVYFNLKPFTIEKLEKALLSEGNDEEQAQEERESSVFSNTSSNGSDTTTTTTSKFLGEFLVQIIRPLVQKKKTGLNATTVNDYLWTILPHYGQVDFNNRSVLEKIKILKEIQDLHLEGSDEKLTALKNEKSPEHLRILPLGTDYQGWTYWYFGDTRLYREIPIPNGKRGMDLINTTDYTFQLLCSTIEDWHAVIKKFQPSNRTSSKELASTICDIGLEIIGKLEARAATMARKELKLKRAKELELIPKKRSRRLEAKFDEEAKRQKMIDQVKQQAELEEIERKETKKREKMIAEQEKQEFRIEEARLRNDVYNHITKLISTTDSIEEQTELKSLRKQSSTTATENDRIYKIQQWIKYSELNIILDIGDHILFKGDDVDKALNNILFKNALNNYFMTCIKFHIQPDTPIYQQLENIRKDLILNRFQCINDFCTQLNAAIKDNQQALTLLRTIFTSLHAIEKDMNECQISTLHTLSPVHN